MTNCQKQLSKTEDLIIFSAKVHDNNTFKNSSYEFLPIEMFLFSTDHWPVENKNISIGKNS